MFAILKRKICTLFNILNNVIIIFNSSIKLKKLRSMYGGERCFIVGNGPSLLVEDLEKIKHEKSFSSHRIYKIYEKTSWRPTFYCIQDYQLLVESKKEVSEMSKESVAIVAKLIKAKYPLLKQFLSIKLKCQDFYPDLPLFSKDVSKCIYEGMTVTYMCLQIAMYMGFKEIYLLGIDHNYSVTLDKNGNVQHHDGIKDHFSEDDKVTNVPALYKSTLAYEAAKKYADEHEIKIYNATRGGKLEVFERVDIDELDFLK